MRSQQIQNDTQGSKTLAVRTADSRDAELVARLLHEFNREFDAATPSREVLTARFTQLIGQANVIVLLAESRVEQTLGFAYLTLRPSPYFDGPLAQLEELYTRPAFRGRGVGSTLLTEAIALLRSRGAGEMHINVDEVDRDARRFYERHGFVNIQPGEDFRMLCYLREFNRLGSVNTSD